MKIDIQKITDGEESVTIRYRELTSRMNRIIGILNDDENRIWGKADKESICVSLDEILYLESVDDKVFAYTGDRILKLEGTLSSFMMDNEEDVFFRCSKSMVINVNKVLSLKSLSSNRIDAVMEGGEHIIISRRYASEFRRLLRGER
ncbi:MAG: LytTR family transcriptional regulator [Lachnospiraceae bacterium]|nr:LytTR family transcriptional regulator [Lachnospiraceae bacterium]